MDLLESLNAKISEFTRARDQQRINDEIKRVLAVSGGLQSAAGSVAMAIHNQQQTATNYNYQQMGTAHHTQAMGGLSGNAMYSEEHVSEAILKTFELSDKATYEFASATAQLLGARIRASWSPNRSPRCTPRKGIVWQLFNHNWMVDVQWIGDKTGGSEEEWTRHFAELADLISEARANGDKQYGDELGIYRPAQFAGSVQAGQQGILGGLSGVSSQSGVAQGGSAASAGGCSLQIGAAGSSVGVGP